MNELESAWAEADDQRTPLTVFLDPVGYARLQAMAATGSNAGPADELASALLADAIYRAFFPGEQKCTN